MATLLEKAKQIPLSKTLGVDRATEEEADLAVAFLNNEVTLKQCKIALGIERYGNAIYQKMFYAIVKAYQTGKIIKV